MRCPRLVREGVDKGEVHLWIARLESSDAAFARSLSWLAPEEIARAERFHFDRHRRAFVLGRAALRALLGNYLGTAPAEIRFVYGPQGKPALAAPPSDESSALRFNVSNSGNLAAYVFTTGCEIGVDLEQYRQVRDLSHIADRFFSPAETAELLALPQEEQEAGFFNCWTRKEAYIKAVGGGLSIRLDSFQVTLRPRAAPRVVLLEGSAERARNWTLHAFTPAPDYAGAIAYPDRARVVQSVPVSPIDELLSMLNC